MDVDGQRAVFPVELPGDFAVESGLADGSLLGGCHFRSDWCVKFVIFVFGLLT